MRRVAVAFAIVTTFVLGSVSVAAAHVTIEPSSAPQGSDAVLTFVVPNESQTSATTKLVVQFPRDHPISDALVEPMPGWRAVVQPLAAPGQPASGATTDGGRPVDTVTWSALAGAPGIPLHQFGEFRVSVGLPADATSLVFKAVQTYADGSTVRWVELAPPGGTEPENPAPVLQLTPPVAEPGSGVTVTTAGPAGATKSDVDSAKQLGVIAIVMAAIALGAGLAGFAFGRRRA